MGSDSPVDFGPVVPPGSARMLYLQSYRYIFERPDWVATVVWGFICNLSAQVVPLVGQMVFAGYECDVLETLHRTGGASYPAFDIRRFADYLARSIPPLLVGVVTSIPFALLVAIAYSAGGIGMLVAADAEVSDDLRVLMVTVIGMGTILMVILGGFLWMFLITPFSLRACLSQEFASSFDIRWAIDFFHRTWLETGLAILFFVVTMLLFSLLGMLMCCIGWFATFTLVCLAETHLYFQLYQLYLSRGGTPIPLRSLPLAPAYDGPPATISQPARPMP